MRKRYSITMDDEVHRRLTVEAVRQGRSLGEYLGGLMDEPIRKAIEPDQVKVTAGKLSKGLGTLPGQEPPQKIAGDPTATKPEKHYFSEFRPAPKPGKGKS